MMTFVSEEQQSILANKITSFIPLLQFSKNFSSNKRSAKMKNGISFEKMFKPVRELTGAISRR
jgi:hypothetical protein